MSSVSEKNILYGGPEAPLIDADSKSLGEVILKKLACNGDDVMFVRLKRSYDNNNNNTNTV